MNPIFSISNQCPRSHNSNSVRAFQGKLRKEFEALQVQYDGLPLKEPYSLYSKIIYIHKGQTNIDVDNMSKPIVDAFKSVIYSDDNIINHRVCSKIGRNKLDINEIELTQFPIQIAEKLFDSFQNDSKDILIFEVGSFNQDMIKFVGI